MIYIYNTKYTSEIHAQAHTCMPHTDTHINQRYVGKRWDLSVVLKDEAEWENLIFFGSVFQSVGAKKEKERSPYYCYSVNSPLPWPVSFSVCWTGVKSHLSGHLSGPAQTIG